MNKYLGSSVSLFFRGVEMETVDELPDPPENPDFAELFTPEQQDAIAGRFKRGIALHEARLTEARERLARSERMALTRKERRALAREAYFKSRFNPVIPHDYLR